MTELLPVWQGWWLGGFLQALLLSAPVLFLFGTRLEAWKRTHVLGEPAGERLSQGWLLATFGVISFALTVYVLLVRSFSMVKLERALAEVEALRTAQAVMSAVEGLSLVHWVTLLLLATLGVFGYQVLVHWTATLRASTEAQSALNVQLQAEMDAREQAQRDLQEKAVALKHALDSRDRFFSIISHDLRNPLGAILNATRTLDQKGMDMPPAQVASFHNLLSTAAENVYDLLENLLEWAQLQTGAMQHQPEALVLTDAIREITNVLTPSAGAKAIALEVDVPDDLTVWADPNMLRAIVLNLATNGIKFTPKGGKVVIEAME